MASRRHWPFRALLAGARFYLLQAVTALKGQFSPALLFLIPSPKLFIAGAKPSSAAAVEQLLAQLQASEHDKFAAHLYRSRREYRSVCQRAGKSGKQIERCVISSFQIAESMGFKGDFRQWEQLLRIGD